MAVKKTTAGRKAAAGTVQKAAAPTRSPKKPVDGLTEGSAPAKKGAAPAKNGAAPARTTAAPAKAPRGPARKSASARSLPVRGDESPWTTAELAEVRTELEADIARLYAEIQVVETGLVGLMRDAGDGAGDDEADAGAKTFEREQEISLVNNHREMLEQSAHALERIADGSYGRCESCGTPIGKLRLQAFPRATLCMTCKQKQERR